MVSRPERFPDGMMSDLVTSLVDSASAADQRDRIGRLLPKLDEIAVGALTDPDARAIARTRLAQAFLVMVGPDAAQRTLSKALDDSDAVGAADARAHALVEAAHGAATLGSFGTDLLVRIEGHAASLDPSPERARLLATLSVAYGKVRDSSKAAKLAIRAMNSAEKIEGLASRIDGLLEVGVTLHAAHASRGDAREALERAQEVARSMPNDAERALALVSVAAALGRLGQAEDGVNALLSALGEPEAEEVAEEEAPPEELSEVVEVVEKAAAPAAVAPAAPAYEDDTPVLPDGFVDPAAGEKFPTFKTRRGR